MYPYACPSTHRSHIRMPLYVIIVKYVAGKIIIKFLILLIILRHLMYVFRYMRRTTGSQRQ